jgi:hypothetical protein
MELSGRGVGGTRVFLLMQELIHKTLGRAVGALLDRPLPPPTEAELARVARLRASFRMCPPDDPHDIQAPGAEWTAFSNRLRELVLQGDPREFLRWDVIRESMFVSRMPYVGLELAWLRRRPDWKTRWWPAIGEARVGRPLPYPFYSRSSGNLIHHAYHLAQFEERTRARVTDVDCIVEFGGGYGSLCRLFHVLGFAGRYLMFDLPPWCLLQRYYLESLGLPVRDAPPQPGTDTRFALCSPIIEEIAAALEHAGPTCRAMFVATWSISEAPIIVRERVWPVVSRCRAYLIGYQHRFAGIDNQAYFEAWTRRMDTHDWMTWEIEHMPGNSYLLGVMRNR